MEPSMPKERSNGFFTSITGQQCLLIGGSNREIAFNDVWLLSPKETKWLKINQSEIITQEITPRAGMAGISYKTPNEIIIYLHGGQNYFTQNIYGDMYEIHIPFPFENITSSSLISITNHTTYPINITNTPCQRNSHCMCYDNQPNNLYIFGGASSES